MKFKIDFKIDLQFLSAGEIHKLKKGRATEEDARNILSEVKRVAARHQEQIKKRSVI